MLREGLSLWRGRALEGFEEQPFARAESVRLEELRLAAGEDLMDSEMLLGRHAAIIGALQSLVAEHPTRERLTAQLMRALYRCGRQAEALLAYKQLRERLVDELGIDPSPELTQLERAVLRQELAEPAPWRQADPATSPWEASAQGEAATAGPLLPQQTPFVGRTAERTQLSALMRRAAAGQGALVMVGGEPGVGKTRLCKEIAAEGARQGFMVFTGHCYEAGVRLAYMPWVELLEAAVRDTPPQVLRDALGDEARELARVVPELRRKFPDIPPPIELPPDQQRRHTFNSTRDYITRVARRRPQIFVLEDLHWADEVTLLLLEHIAERVDTIPLLILGTYRDAAVDLSPALEQTLAALVRRRQAGLISLSRHSEHEVTELLQALSGHPPPAAVVASIYHETEGNAFYVEEVFRHLEETGKLLEEDGRFRADLRIEALDIPHSVRLVTGRRLDRLNEATRRTLTLAAVVGRRFTLRVLEAVGETDTDTLLDALDEAVRAGVCVTEPSASEAAYSFGHELVLHTLLARLSPARRQRHHLRVAAALERVYADDLGRHAADIAHHLVEAGDAADPVRTTQYCTLAGERSQHAAAFEEALRHFSTALSVNSAHDERRRADLLLKVGLAQRSLCRWNDAIATWSETLVALERLGDIDTLARLCWDFCNQLAWVYKPEEATAVARRGLAAVGSGAGRHRALLLAASVLGLSEAGRFEEATTALEEATTLAAREVDASLVAVVAMMEMFHRYTTMQFPLALEPGRRAVERLREAGSPWDLATAMSLLDIPVVYLGHFRESDELHADFGPLADRIGHWGAALFGRRNVFAKTAARSADLGELDATAHAQLQVARETENLGWLAHSHTLCGIVEFWRGDWDTARMYMEEGARLGRPAVTAHWFGMHVGFLFMLLTHLGRRDQAFALLDEVGHALPVTGRSSSIGSWNLAALVGEGVAVLGDAERARTLYPLVTEALATGTLMRQFDGALLERVAGMVAATAGLREEAEGHFETALRQSEALPHLLERPHVSHHYGRFLMDRRGGDRARARTLLREALDGYRRIGMPRHAAMAEELLSLPSSTDVVDLAQRS
jgi:tetratricopeptide (TPR) repeat protein